MIASLYHVPEAELIASVILVRQDWPPNISAEGSDAEMAQVVAVTPNYASQPLAPEEVTGFQVNQTAIIDKSVSRAQQPRTIRVALSCDSHAKRRIYIFKVRVVAEVNRCSRMQQVRE
jgi:hypothetical protein